VLYPQLEGVDDGFTQNPERCRSSRASRLAAVRARHHAGHGLPEIATGLRQAPQALQALQPELAGDVGRRGSSWLQDVARTLPPMWRDNCLSRSPLRWGPIRSRNVR
jgi:hypothetical protein